MGLYLNSDSLPPAQPPSIAVTTPRMSSADILPHSFDSIALNCWAYGPPKLLDALDGPRCARDSLGIHLDASMTKSACGALVQVRRGVTGQGLGLPLPEALREPSNPTAES